MSLQPLLALAVKRGANVKKVVLGAALLICGSQANAVFVSATSGTPGIDFQQSFARLQAEARGGDEQILNPLPIPYTGQMQAQYAPSGDGAYAYAAETYSLGANLLQVSVTRLDRNGPSFVFSNGAWIFSVTETVNTVASGFLAANPSGYLNENYLSASLYDLTANLSLFDSNQADHASGGFYNLGGLVGIRVATFSGSLENVLQSGHVYRLIYGLGVSNREAGADNSFATGRISLMAQPVPEPATWAMLCTGLLAVCGSVAMRRRSGPAAVQA